MDMFQQMKDMQSMIHDAPERIASAQETAKNAQALSAADFEPVNGVSLELYVQVSKGVAASGGDQSQAPLIAAAQGISPSDWESATAIWNRRMTTNREVGRQFSALYQAV